MQSTNALLATADEYTHVKTLVLSTRAEAEVAVEMSPSLCSMVVRLSLWLVWAPFTLVNSRRHCERMMGGRAPRERWEGERVVLQKHSPLPLKRSCQDARIAVMQRARCEHSAGWTMSTRKW